MIKKGPGVRDHRVEPDDSGSGAEKHRVDRVYAPVRRASGSTRDLTPPTRRPRPSTASPPIGLTESGLGGDTELALRRQLSRLQHQLAEAQRELAHKDDELATSVEKRVELSAAYDEAVNRLRGTQDSVHELAAHQAQLAGIEERLQSAVATAQELEHQLARERAERGALAVQFDEANQAFERARTQWRTEQTGLEQRHTSELSRIEQHKRSVVEIAEQSISAQLDRQRRAHEAELAELRAGLDRELAALKGEIAPKVAEARNLTAEIERLTNEIGAMRAEHLRDLAERIELDKWEQQQEAEAHNAALEELRRTTTLQIRKADDEIARGAEALGLAERNAILREQLWEQTLGSLRASQKELQQQVTTATEKQAQAEASRKALEQRLAAMQTQVDTLTDELAHTRDELDDARTETRRTSFDRERFVAYLEQGLAMLGAANADSDEPEINVISADDDTI